MISHDLDLLDEAITRVLHLDRPAEDAVGHIVEYKGTYSQYRTSRALDEERLARKAMLQTKEIARLQIFVDRFGAKATKASMAHSKEKQIARIEQSMVKVERRRQGDARCRFPDPPTSGITVIESHGLKKGYGGPPVFEDVSFDLGRGERLLVLGLNGAGKTSLLRILAGETERRRRRRSRSATTSTSATTRRSTTTCAATRRCSHNIRSAVPPGRACSPRRSCAACSA